MSSKYAPITASLLARKGAAGPSNIFKSAIDWNAPAQTPLRPAPELKILGHEKFPAANDAESDHACEEHHPARDEAHHLRKIQVGLSDRDHERLRILSARRETSRQQIVREALAHYFALRAHEYRDECRCLSDDGCNGMCCD